SACSAGNVLKVNKYGILFASLLYIIFNIVLHGFS
ncbi:unnamed protein product, partial [marine sediment metagenome]